MENKQHSVLKRHVLVNKGILRESCLNMTRDIKTLFCYSVCYYVLKSCLVSCYINRTAESSAIFCSRFLFVLLVV